MDVLTFLANALIQDDYVIEQTSFINETGDTEYRIKFYEYPEVGDVSGAYIVIDPLSSPLPDEYGGNTPITNEHLIQVDVWSKNRLVTQGLSEKVADIFRGLGFGNNASGVDEYDKDTGIFRVAKRYNGKIYRTQN